MIKEKNQETARKWCTYWIFFYIIEIWNNEFKKVSWTFSDCLISRSNLHISAQWAFSTILILRISSQGSGSEYCYPNAYNFSHFTSSPAHENITESLQSPQLQSTAGGDRHSGGKDEEIVTEFNSSNINAT